MMSDVLPLITALLVAAFLGLMLRRPPSSTRYTGIQPEMRPGPKDWVLGNKEAGTGERLEPLRRKGGQYLCPDCGSPELLSGPSGGMAQNVGCNTCLHEFNIGLFDDPPLVMEKRGKMTADRAGIFGISPEEYAEIDKEERP